MSDYSVWYAMNEKDDDCQKDLISIKKISIIGNDNFELA